MRTKFTKVLQADGTIVEVAKRVAHGAIGAVKAKAGIGKAPQEIIDQRRQICESCEECVPCWDGSQVKCCGPLKSVLTPQKPVCGCRIDLKTRLAREACPKGKWSAHDPETRTNDGPRP